VLPLGGCYYMQAISGHTQLMSQRRPMTEVMADPAASEALKERLRLVQEARQFSIEELKLPDNDSYRSYADLGRDYVVWNVFAAPEFSLKPKQWCYFVAGCVAYRGYFDREDAVKESDGLREDGFDVAMGGVSAYSTLGKFADPVLNTMMQWSNADLVATLFHELAHQELYVKGDTQFNESFASAVSDIGLERWFSSRGSLETLEEYRDTNALRHQLLQLVQDAKTDLRLLYALDIEDDEKRRQKRERLDALSADASSLFATAGLDSSPLPAPLNNARLVSLGLYEGWVPAFRAMYVECGERITCLYGRAREVASLPVNERTARLELLSASQEEPERVAELEGS
jgi:predicted aminopeptidase